MYKQDLNGLWTMNRLGDDKAYEVNVPTTVYHGLYDNGAIDDPFYGENDVKLTKLSDEDYRFVKEFEMEKSLLDCSRIDIIFEGLDTLATVKINGNKLAKTNNMHRTYRFELKELLIEGLNILEVTFDSPTKYIASEQAKDPLWGIATTMDGYEYIRKAHHMFGWDWGPQLPDMGVWRSVRLEGYKEGRLKDFYLKQNHKKDEVAIELEIVSEVLAEDLTLNVRLLDSDGDCVKEVDQVITTGQDVKSEIDFTILNPKLWWPNGYGDPYLYTLSLAIMDGDRIVDQLNKRVGLRSMTVHREADPWGETFDFKVNGHRIFAMGADYIPEDALITRPTKAVTERLIRDCVKANYNCLRVWGGGIYPSDDLFDLCDENGLIVWQDFMFACGVYRLTKAFEDNIRQEFIDNIKRIRHHACLGLWCGNNEMEWGFEEWGIPKDERLRMDYLLMYEKLIPDVLAEYDPQTFYWPASPSSGGGFNEPNADNKGDVHYWQVFHGNEHYKKFRDHYFRFASEYGMQAFPDYKTVLSYTPEDQLNMFSPVSENHNKCIEPMNGNVKILLNMAQEFKLPTTFEDQVYISQVFQGETIKCAVEHFRRNRGRCMGSTYWQVNDNYPVASWSSIDYYGRWKAMHYMARRFYAPVLLSAYEDGLIAHIHLTNDKLDAFNGRVKWQLRHTEKGVLVGDSQDVAVAALFAEHIVDIEADEFITTFGEERKLYITYQLYDQDDKQVSSESILFVCHKSFEFESASVSALVYDEGDSTYIKVTSDGFAKSVEISFTELDVVLSDNYFDLIAGERRIVEIEEFRGCEKLSLEEMQGQMQLKSVSGVGY